MKEETKRRTYITGVRKQLWAEYRVKATDGWIEQRFGDSITHCQADRLNYTDAARQCQVDRLGTKDQRALVSRLKSEVQSSKFEADKYQAESLKFYGIAKTCEAEVISMRKHMKSEAEAAATNSKTRFQRFMDWIKGR